ncbi:hypothetical protein HYH03_017757 [Edaphochlamys debaryana]|uniref:Uncharacterized protein n=1 Tax=Edaphochlamys debaryana TaxID=47281 RepID=A0A836BNZ4_9CHLO|nr:hypothetical protein HYH03_017757 [Edaphochlamys debaryana]|eukprot:KAG2483357.1 hypothetical protein HYH03_017757 [Edaphochlamys debaryana]
MGLLEAPELAIGCLPQQSAEELRCIVPDQQNAEADECVVAISGCELYVDNGMSGVYRWLRTVHIAQAGGAMLTAQAGVEG